MLPADLHAVRLRLPGLHLHRPPHAHPLPPAAVTMRPARGTMYDKHMRGWPDLQVVGWNYH